MKGQNFIFTLFICLFAVTAMNAQQEKAEKDGGLFVRANVGYGFEGLKTVQGVDVNRERGINIYGSGAPGLTLGAGVGYMFNKYVGLELGLTYTFGVSKLSEIETDNRPLGISAAGQSFDLLTAYVFQEYTHKTTQVRIIPAIVVRGGDGKVVPYAKVGMVVPVAGKTNTKVKGTLSSTEIPTSIAGIPLPIPGFGPGVSLAGSVDAEAESFGQFSLGFDATVGVDYKLNDKISLFGELNMVALTIKSKETKVTRYDGEYGLDGSPVTLDELINGVNAVTGLFGTEISIASLGLYNNISEVPASEAHFIYVDELNASTNNPAFNDNFNENEPLDDYARRDNFSSVGINIGVKFNF